MPLALKIDVDTYEGIKNGAARLARFLRENKIPASFFVTLGPDTSGRAATRVFRQKGFLQKMRRTSAVSVYGLRTILSGTLLPARPMGLSFREEFLKWKEWGFEVSPHGYDHIVWHDEAANWDERRAKGELEKILRIYRHLFGEEPQSFAAPGWQAGEGTWRAMEPMKLLYHSDTRGTHPFLPSPLPLSRAHAGEGETRTATGEGTAGSFRTLEIPTTLPTWDEMLTWPGMTRHTLADKTWELLKSEALNVWTIHSEFEGDAYFPQFHEFVERAQEEHLKWAFLPDVARALKSQPDNIPCDTIRQGSLPGRAGTVSIQQSS